LLARVLNFEDADPILKEATAGPKPSAYALYARGFDALCRGQFPEALRFIEQADEKQPRQPTIEAYLREAMIASGASDRLVQRPPEQAGQGPSFGAAAEEVRAAAAKGDSAKAHMLIDQTLKSLSLPEGSSARPMVESSLRAIAACAAGDTIAYLKL